MLSIVDYGMANLRSVQKALEAVGAVAQIVSRPDEIVKCDAVVLPGVGAFKHAIATLRARSLDGPIVDHIRRGRPFLGICLGMQMLFEVGREDGEHTGLGVLAGEVVRFDVDAVLGLKVPHMGWNQLEFRAACPLFAGLGDGASAYFVHSYHVVPADGSVIASTTEYGRPFVSSIRRDNVMGVQFHPEKSQQVGLAMLANFAAIAG